jgi:hypothetical protein
MTNSKHDVEALEALASTLTDSINGYEEPHPSLPMERSPDFCRRRLKSADKSRRVSGRGSRRSAATLKSVDRLRRPCTGVFWISAASSKTIRRRPLPRSNVEKTI